MPSTINLRRQHDAASALADAILSLADHCRSRQDAYDVSLMLAKLLGLLRIHLAQEDRSLYPAMMNSADPKAAALAAQFAAEMGGLAEQMEAFATRWTCSAAIYSGLEEFRREANHLFAALDRRIRRENNELYPLAERMAAKASQRDAA